MKIHEIYTERKKASNFQYDTNISLLHQYVYFSVGKVANSTIKVVFSDIEYENYPGAKSLQKVHDKDSSPFLSPYQLPQDILQQVFFGDKFYRFAFVRNPYSRLLSCYLDRIQDLRSAPRAKALRIIGVKDNDYKLTFEEFINAICRQKSVSQNKHWRRQSDELMISRIPYSFIGNFECLSEDLKKISVDLFGEIKPGMRDLSRNFSPSITNASKLVADYFSEELQDQVFQSYKSDFENFGYSFELGACAEPPFKRAI